MRFDCLLAEYKLQFELPQVLLTAWFMQQKELKFEHE